MERPNRLPYKFPEFAIDYYYKFYSHGKNIDEEDNCPILLEIMVISLGRKETMDLLLSSADMRIKLHSISKSTFEFMCLFFNYFIRDRSHMNFIKSAYYKLFDAPFPKKLLWEDFIYKFKFKHLHPDLDFNFPNPYKNSDEVVF